MYIYHTNLQKRGDQVLRTLNEHAGAQSVTIVVVTEDAVRSLFDPAADEVGIAKEVQARGGATVCKASDTVLNELAGLVPREDEPAKSGSKPSKLDAASDKKVTLTAREIRRIRTPVEKLLADSLARFEARLDILIKDSQRNRQTLIALMKLAGGQSYERIKNPVSTRPLVSFAVMLMSIHVGHQEAMEGDGEECSEPTN